MNPPQQEMVPVFDLGNLEMEVGKAQSAKERIRELEEELRRLRGEGSSR